MVMPRRPSLQSHPISALLTQFCLVCGVGGFRATGDNHVGSCISNIITDIRHQFVQLDQEAVLNRRAALWKVRWGYRFSSVQSSATSTPRLTQGDETWADIRGAVAHIFRGRGSTLGESWPEFTTLAEQLEELPAAGGKTGSSFWLLSGTPLLLKRGTKPEEAEKLQDGLLLSTLLHISRKVKEGLPPLLVAPLALFECGSEYYTLQQAAPARADNIRTFDVKGSFFDHAQFDKHFVAMGEFQEGVRESLGAGLLAKAPVEAMGYFVKALGDDVEHLSQQKVMDYSLLLHVSKEGSKNGMYLGRTARADGSASLDFMEDGIAVAGYRIHVAIIDYFGPFDATKLISRYAKHHLGFFLPKARQNDLLHLRRAVEDVLREYQHLGCTSVGEWLCDAAAYTLTDTLDNARRQVKTQYPVYYGRRFKNALVLQLVAAGEMWDSVTRLTSWDME